MSFFMRWKERVLKNLGGHLLQRQKNCFAFSTMFFFFVVLASRMLDFKNSLMQ